MSQTYLVGEKNINPDYYQNGHDFGDNNYSMYVGADKDNLRAASTAYPPVRDTMGVHIWWNFGGAHAGRWQAVFCDGSVHSVSYSIDPLTHQRLGHRSDGEVVDASSL